MSSDIFKIQGGGQNFVHGGASLQELVLPLISVKILKGKQDTKLVTISATNVPSKITNLVVKINILQNEAVSNVWKAAKYSLYFKSDQGEIITNQISFAADSAITKSDKRMSSVIFQFKNQEYSKNRKYFFIAEDTGNQTVTIHHEVLVDLMRTDDYGF